MATEACGMGDVETVSESPMRADTQCVVQDDTAAERGTDSLDSLGLQTQTIPLQSGLQAER